MILLGNKQNSLILLVFFFHFLGWRSPYIILVSAPPWDLMGTRPKKARFSVKTYSLSPGVWQSFVTIRSCNHLMRIISTMSTTQRKVRSSEDDNYSNWVIINYGVYKGLYHISCLLQIIKPFIRPPQGLLFLVVKTF